MRQRFFSRPLLVLFCVASVFNTAAAEEPGSTNWVQFRGPGNRGVAEGAGLPERWSATENVAWKTEIPGRGWSSPIVWGDRVFITTVVNEGQTEKPKKGLYFGGNRPKPTSVHHWKVICLNLKSGKIVWQKEVHKGKPESGIHLKSSFASETPITDGERVYCYFGNLGLFCFSLDGKLVWTKKMKVHKTRFGWGTAASPVLHEDRLYLVNDNEEDSYLLALNKKTGKEIWRVKRKEKSNWATPFIWKNARRTEIVTPGTGKVRSYSLTGKLLWTLTGMSSITIATPYEHNGLLFVTSGYVLSALRPIYAIRPGATGDLTLPKGKTESKWIAWSNPKAAPYNPSTLIYRNNLYVLYDRGIIAAYNPKDGSPLFGRKRIPNGRAYTSSPWAYNGKVFCLNEDGVTTVMQADGAHKFLHQNKLAEDDMCMATPAIAGNRLLIRTAKRIYCIRKGK
jgi:outer membrane protein assembly factor BamB